MPTNLPPEYYDAEERFRAAVTIEEKAERLEELLSTIPQHKGTDHLRADLRRKLSKLKSEAQSGRKGVSRHESVFHIEREGAGQVVLVGPPNSGKSALVKALSNAAPEVAPFPFTTWTPTPGMMLVDNVQIQLIDTPPLHKEYVDPQLLDLIRRAEMMVLVVDIQTAPLEQIDDTVALLAENRIIPAHQRMAGDDRGRFIPTLVVANKVDDESWDEEFAALGELVGEEWPCLLAVAAERERGLDRLRWAVFDALELMRVYAKPPNREADLTTPFVLKRGSAVETFAAKVHKDFLEQLKCARVWGTGVFDGQMVSRDHILHDGDIVELRT
ncbi:MAG: GTPase [Anaerolineae bacterium]|nr:GTPase [Anaerolineae bacterium]